MIRTIAITVLFAVIGALAGREPAGAKRVHESRLAALIDSEIDRRLAESGVAPSPPADDAEFLRRATLDLTGTVPTLERVRSFLGDRDPDRRAKLIDDLLASPAFGRRLAEQWADILIKRDFDSNRALKTEPFIRWLAERINADAGWDGIVREMVTASGSEADNPAALFVLANQDMFQPSPAKLAAATANLFLGISLHCAECHEHPTVPEWKPQDFWGLAAFYGHLRFEREGNLPAPKNPNPVRLVEIERRSEPRSRLARRNGERAVEPGAVIAIPDPTDNTKSIGTVPAKYFGGESPRLRSVPYRPALADWLTAPDNALFARAAVNRIWAQMFARGLVQPLEDMHPDNAATHPAILHALADEFAASGFDVKRVFRAIALSAAYQRTSRPTDANAEDTTLLSHMPVKVLGPRELLASIATITGVRERSPRSHDPRFVSDDPGSPAAKRRTGAHGSARRPAEGCADGIRRRRLGAAQQRRVRVEPLRRLRIAEFGLRIQKHGHDVAQGYRSCSIPFTIRNPQSEMESVGATC